MAKNISEKFAESKQSILVRRVEKTLQGMQKSVKEGDYSTFNSFKNKYICLSRLMKDSGIDQKIINNYNTRTKLYNIKARELKPNY